MRRPRPGLILASLLALDAPAGVTAAEPVRKVIVDHDGGVDDLIAIALLMKSGQVDVRAITVDPADSFLESATRATELFVDALGGRGVTIAKGHDEGTNPFPDEWRKDAGRVLEVAALKGMRPRNLNPVVKEDAAHHLVGLLSGPGAYEILETGPLNNIADALRLNPAIRTHIRRIYIMGGAVRVAGNVQQPGHDGSAEWNIYNQPKAAAEVIASGIPITLIPLDATNKVPLTRAFVGRLEAEHAPIAQLAAQAWRVVIPRDGPEGYYFWDTLTAAAMLEPDVVALKTIRVKVITDGPSQGRTMEAADGMPIQVAVDADQAKVEALFLRLLGR